MSYTCEFLPVNSGFPFYQIHCSDSSSSILPSNSAQSYQNQRNSCKSIKSPELLKRSEEKKETRSQIPEKSPQKSSDVNLSAIIPLKKKSLSHEDETDHKSPLIPILERSCSMNFSRKPFNFVNKHVKTSNEELRKALSGIGRICDDHTKKIITDILDLKKETERGFIDLVIDQAINPERKFQIEAYAGLVSFLIDKENKKNEKERNNQGITNNNGNMMKKCLFRGIQDVFEAKSKHFDCGIDSKKNVINIKKSNFLYFLKELNRLKVFKQNNIKNCIIILLLMFFRNKAEENKKQCELDFQRMINLDFMVQLICLLYKKSGSSINNEKILEILNKEKFSFFEYHYLKAKKECIIHNFSKDILKIFNFIKENFEFKNILIKEIFTVSNDYLIILEKDIHNNNQNNLDAH